MLDLKSRVKDNILDLSNCNINNHNIKSLLESIQNLIEKRPEINHLNLSENWIGASGAKVLAASQILENFTILNLSWNDLSDEGTKELAASKYIRNLSTLNLSDNYISDKGTKKLALSKYLSNLNNLDLSENYVGNQGAKALAESNYFSKLNILDLSRNDIGNEGARSLAVSKYLSYLTTLNLSWTDIDNEGTKALAASDSFTNLINLDLSRNNIEAEGARELGLSTTFKNLQTLNLSENDIGDKGAKELAISKYLTNLITLNLSRNNIGKEGTKELGLSTTLKNLINLNLSENYIGEEGVKKLGLSKTLTNLKNLNLSENFIGDEGAKAIADSDNLKNLISLNLSKSSMSTHGAKAIADSNNLENLNILDLSNNNICSEGAKAIVDSYSLKNLNNLNLSGNKINAEGEIVLAKFSSQNNLILSLSEKSELLASALKESKGNLTKEITKELVFQLAFVDNTGEYIKYLIENPDEYQFPINSLNSQGHNLLHFYNNDLKMQQFLFNQGMIPEKEMELTMGQLAIDSQGVHVKEINELNHFIIGQLMESYSGTYDTLLASAESYLLELKNLSFTPLESKLLSLSAARKKDTLKKVLEKEQSLPDDQKFIDIIKKKSTHILENEYLREDSAYYTHQNGYNYNYSSAEITIPKTIGLVKQLIDNREQTFAEKKELLVTLISYNPELVENNLSLIQKKMGEKVTLKQLANATECYQLLKNSDIEVIVELFTKISNGLYLDATLKKQQQFQIAEFIYFAATAYGENSPSCIGGAWGHIVNAANAINPDFINKFSRFKDQEKARESLEHAICQGNIDGFIKNLSTKLINSVKDDYLLQEALSDFALAMVDINKAEDITISQQKILAKINQIFSQEIKGFLTSYTRTIPKESEYKIIIKKLYLHNPILAKFAINHKNDIIEESALKTIDLLQEQDITNQHNDDVTTFYDLASNLSIDCAITHLNNINDLSILGELNNSLYYQQT